MGSVYQIGASHCCNRRLPPLPPLTSLTIEPSVNSVEVRAEKGDEEEEKDDDDDVLDETPSKETTTTMKRTRAQHAHATTEGAGAPLTSVAPRAPRMAKGPQEEEAPLTGSKGTGER